MSTNAITSSLLSDITSSSSTSNQFASDLNQVAGDLQSGNLSSAQQDYVTLSTDALDGKGSTSATTTSSGITTSLLSNIASSSSSSGSFVSELNQLGADLENNDLTSSQEDMLTLSSTALNAASSSSSTSSTSGSSASTTSSTAMAGQPLPATLQTDIRAIIQAMDSGVSSAANSAMAQLASDAQNSPGTNYFKEIGETPGSSSSSSSTSSAAVTPDTVTGLLQSLDSAQTNINSLVSSATSSNS